MRKKIFSKRLGTESMLIAFCLDEGIVTIGIYYHNKFDVSNSLTLAMMHRQGGYRFNRYTKIMLLHH